MAKRNIQTIRRKKDRERFVTIERTFLDDIELSAKAKGVLATILGYRDDWKLIVENLVKQFSDGRDLIRSAMIELREMGYIEAVEFRIKGKSFAREYFVYEQPFFVDRENFNPRKVRIVQLASEEEYYQYGDSDQHYEEERTMRQIVTYLSLSKEEKAERGKKTSAIRKKKPEMPKPRKKKKEADINLSEELDDLLGTESGETLEEQGNVGQTGNPSAARLTENPPAEIPPTEKPPAGKPPTENPTLTIINNNDLFTLTIINGNYVLKQTNKQGEEQIVCSFVWTEEMSDIIKMEFFEAFQEGLTEKEIHRLIEASAFHLTAIQLEINGINIFSLIRQYIVSFRDHWTSPPRTTYFALVQAGIRDQFKIVSQSQKEARVEALIQSQQEQASVSESDFSFYDWTGSKQ